MLERHSLNSPAIPSTHPPSGRVFVRNQGLFHRDQIIGRNCRFLQGPKTDVAEVNKIREAVHADPPRSVTVTLLNYRFDGTTFWNALHIAPVRNADGRVAYLVGVQLNAHEVRSADAEPLDQIVLPDVASPLSRRGRSIPVCQGIDLKQTILHSGTVGKIRVAIRSLSGSQGGLRRSAESKKLPMTSHQPFPHKE